MSGGIITVLCHGFASEKDSRTNLRIEEFLNKHKKPSLRFDFFGHGESRGDFAEVTISKAVWDIKAAISFLVRKGYAEFGLVGSSFGGLASILSAPELTGLKYLALKSPVSDYMSRLFEGEGNWDVNQWREQGFHIYRDHEGRERRLNYSFYEDASIDCGYDASLFIQVPTLIIHGEEDEIVPVAQSLKLSKMIPDCRLEIIPGADHGYSIPSHFEIMIDRISRFVINYLV